jgi:uncharacterized RDD family membrane protein YckC
MTVQVRAGYAGPVSRTLAYVFDASLVAIAATVAVAGLGVVASVLGSHIRDLAHAITAAYIVVLPALLASYMFLCWWLAGRTLGMTLLGLRVVTVRGGRVHWLAALVRALVLAYFPIGALWALVDRRYQAVHDKLAHTSVVRMPG